MFLGHAVAVTDPDEVSAYLDLLLSDKKIAKATHPTIYAYRILKRSGPNDEPTIIAGQFR